MNLRLIWRGLFSRFSAWYSGSMDTNLKKEKLDTMVVTIELTLLSVIQGVALYFLAENAHGPILMLDYEYWVYIFTAFLFLVVFWSQALVHVVSFISWPIEFVHMFLYFLVVITEVLMFQSITNPPNWFATNIVFFVVVGFLYYADLVLLKSKKAHFEGTEAGRTFYTATLKDQTFGMWVLVPLGFIFSLGAFSLVYFYPTFFIEEHWHLALAAFQAFVGIGFLYYLVSVFKKRLDVMEGI